MNTDKFIAWLLRQPKERKKEKKIDSIKKRIERLEDNIAHRGNEMFEENRLKEAQEELKKLIG
jgi:L-lactate utilization protein LutB